MSERTSTPTVTLLKSALAHHQEGRLDEAEGLYRQVLECHPDQQDALRLLGSLYRQRGDPETARTLLERALQIQPAVAETYLDLGLVWFDLHRYGEAVDAYRQALRICPIFPEAHYNLANAYYALRDYSSAAACYREAANQRPDLAEAYFNLGLLEQDQGNEAEALLHYDQALRVRPDYPEALLNCGLAQSNLGQLEAAADSYLKALAVRPDYLEAWLNLGCVRQREVKLSDAEGCFQRVLALDPANIAARLNLAMVLDGLGKPNEAEREARAAVNSAPQNPRAQSYLGALLLRSHRLEEAIDCANRALEFDPNFVPAHATLAQALLILNKLADAARRCEVTLNLDPANVSALTCLGVVRTRQRRPWEALVALEKAVSHNPHDSDAMINLAICELLLGRFTPGWKHYEARWTTQMTFCVPRKFRQPCWRGEQFPGRTLLLYGEQGFGDTIQFIRYARLAAERGGRVVLECQPALKALLRTAAGIDQVLGYGEPLPSFDFQAPLLSLPALFETTNETIPVERAYLRAGAVHPDPLPQTPGTRLKVGLAWCGSRSQNHDQRPVPLSSLRRLLEVEGIAFYCFQKAPAPAKLESDRLLEERVIDLSSRLTDFSITAALVEQLDLVITIDTALAHLAGAMGQPVWVLLPFAPDWRWTLEGETCAWYPTMRLFRQTMFGDWSDPIRRVAAELAALNERTLIDAKARGRTVPICFQVAK